jgi:TPR repeat protein
MVGECYYFGRGVAQDYTASAGWYRHAANEGDSEAQYMMGVFYYNGFGV